MESKKINNSEKSEASEDSENFNYPVSIIEDLKKEVDLPIENESEESSEFLLEGKEEEVKLNILFEMMMKTILMKKEVKRLMSQKYQSNVKINHGLILKNQKSI